MSFGFFYFFIFFFSPCRSSFIAALVDSCKGTFKNPRGTARVLEGSFAAINQGVRGGCAVEEGCVRWKRGVCGTAHPLDPLASTETEAVKTRAVPRGFWVAPSQPSTSASKEGLKPRAAPHGFLQPPLWHKFHKDAPETCAVPRGFLQPPSRILKGGCKNPRGTAQVLGASFENSSISF